ncbi:uncharacterized protein LOC144880484 isoform X2 [Branchiostoma floridae x Branchiostoma japonicum]
MIELRACGVYHSNLLYVYFSRRGRSGKLTRSRGTVNEESNMLRICEKLREVDEKSRRFGLVRTEPDYLRALLGAMADMDRCVEVEVLKSLGDVNLEKGRHNKDPEKFDWAMVLYRTALLRCQDPEVGESVENRYLYAEKLRLGEVPTASISYEPLAKDREMPSIAQAAEKLLPLDQLLADGCTSRDLVLAEYTKFVVEGIVNGDNVLEVEAIKSLGDVYLKRGTESRDTMYLTKATALYNTALVRCNGSQGKAALVHRLLYTAKIRQETENIRKRVVNKKTQLQQLDINKKTSVNNDVITGLQFMLPSALFARQRAKATSPDYRSYEEHLATGDLALTAGKLDIAERQFASALKLIHDRNKPDRSKEAECLCRLDNSRG